MAVVYVLLFFFFLCRVWNMQHIHVACEQVLCLGKGEKRWEEREGKGGEPLDKPLRLLFHPLVN